MGCQGVSKGTQVCSIISSITNSLVSSMSFNASRVGRGADVKSKQEKLAPWNGIVIRFK